ncbi:MAG: hypothetical protein KA435_09870 [Azonexus sp.]|nr:hypothetical protein [Azonexus sp.]
MAISIDWPNRVILSDASITDLPAFHATLRGLEDDAAGAIHPVTHTWKALDLGGGAFFYQADLINGYALEFSGSGPFQVSGNLNGTINDTGVQVERKTSAAYVTTAIGGSGPSAEDIAAAVLAALSATTIPVDAKKLNGATVIGDGTDGNAWRGVGVSP